jgi:uncharacterized protein (UPF0335 family)
MSDILTEFVDQLVSVYGSHLVSVVLYGSKASGEAVEKHSDYNVLLVLTDAGFSNLKRIEGQMSRWIKAGNRPPLIFSRAMLDGSLDVFPIEFLDIKDSHKVLWGENVINDLSISDANLRHQCEYELKGKLLRLRQLYLESQKKPRVLKEIMINTISPVMAVSRHILRLAGENPSLKKAPAMERLARRAGFDYNALGAVLALKQGDEGAQRCEPEMLFENYINAVEKIADFVDKL